MILIAGIGNGDVKYYNTRHNAGYFGIEVLKIALRYEGFRADYTFKYSKYEKSDLIRFKWGGGEEIILQKFKGFMNESGKYVKKLYDDNDVKHLILFHDDLDIKLGEYKIQYGKSPHGHNGVNSVEESMGTKDFLRVRIGIENRGDRQIPGEKYVLERFTQEEMVILKEGLVGACEELLLTDIFEKWI
ncbi:aminoacyl-tRNA hydrolase [bacterium]|nr:aminoacyl-tRNA hydrolase [bacterium]